MAKNRKSETVKPDVTVTSNTFTMPTTFRTVSEIGYNAAKYVDGGSILARALLDANIGWPDNMSDDNMALLKSGIVLRKNEITKPTWYKVEGRNLVQLDAAPSDAELKAAPGTFLRMDVNYATGFTPHQLGSIKDSHPAEHEAVVKLRKAVSKYVSQVVARLKLMTTAMADADASGESKRRGANKSMRDRLTEFFEGLRKSNKTARNTRKDPTAFPDDVLDRKIAAFWKTE